MVWQQSLSCGELCLSVGLCGQWVCSNVGADGLCGQWVCSNVGADGLCGQWVCSNVGAWVLKHAGAVRAAMWVQCVQRMNLLHVAYGVQGHMVCCIPCVQDTVVRKAMSVIHWFVVVHLKLSKIVT